MLREQFRAWGKARPVVLVLQQGFPASESTVARILTYGGLNGDCNLPVKWQDEESQTVIFTSTRNAVSECPCNSG